MGRLLRRRVTPRVTATETRSPEELRYPERCLTDFKATHGAPEIGSRTSVAVAGVSTRAGGPANATGRIGPADHEVVRLA